MKQQPATNQLLADFSKVELPVQFRGLYCNYDDGSVEILPVNLWRNQKPLSQDAAPSSWLRRRCRLRIFTGSCTNTRPHPPAVQTHALHPPSWLLHEATIIIIIRRHIRPVSARLMKPEQTGAAERGRRSVTCDVTGTHTGCVKVCVVHLAAANPELTHEPSNTGPKPV